MISVLWVSRFFGVYLYFMSGEKMVELGERHDWAEENIDLVDPGKDSTE